MNCLCSTDTFGVILMAWKPQSNIVKDYYTFKSPVRAGSECIGNPLIIFAGVQLKLKTGPRAQRDRKQATLKKKFCFQRVSLFNFQTYSIQCFCFNYVMKMSKLNGLHYLRPTEDEKRTVQVGIMKSFKTEQTKQQRETVCCVAFLVILNMRQKTHDSGSYSNVHLEISKGFCP